MGHVFSDMEIISIYRGRPRSRRGGFQLGHVFSDMEICVYLVSVQGMGGTVSIGPRLFRHGNFNHGFQYETVKMGFNWATSFQTWKYYHQINSACQRAGVSIGPRLFRHGNPALMYGIMCRIVWRFQLGHVFSDMEILTLDGNSSYQYAGFNWATSFQTWKCRTRDETYEPERINWCFNWATSFQTWKFCRERQVKRI